MNKFKLLPIAAIALIATLLNGCKDTVTTNTSPIVTGLTCSSVTFSTTATANKAFNATTTLPYAGGNAVAYPAGTAISSTGVSGLSATLAGGTLASGAGNLTFNITGTPTSAGSAIFAVSFGGQSCSITLAVNAAAVSITALTCTSASFSSTSTINTAYSGTATVPYTGGNGVAYSAGSAVTSTGVSGLSATLTAGTLTSSTGNLSFTITGTPTTSGTATFAISFGGQSCNLTLTVGTATSTAVVAPYNKIYGATSITSDGTFITIKTNDLPDHKSIYYTTTNALYETFSGTTYAGKTFSKAPNTIASQTLTFKIPANPTSATTKASTPMGPIGISINGVPFFNQYAAGGAEVNDEIASFDQWWGHPQMSGQYHYHVEPKYLTTVKATKSSLVGFLLDGFPVYGPEENGKTLVTADLDSYHGHTTATADYPNGIYHYHFTLDTPYLNGAGFYGTAGTVSQ